MSRRALWRWAFLALWLVYAGYWLWRGWGDAIERDPEVSVNSFLWETIVAWAPIMAIAIGLLAAIGVALAWDRRLLRSSVPPQGPITPAFVLQHYPIHLGVCVALVALSAWGMFTAPTMAMVMIGLAGGASVSLARRLGLEPPNDPAAPQNQGKV